MASIDPVTDAVEVYGNERHVEGIRSRDGEVANLNGTINAQTTELNQQEQTIGQQASTIEQQEQTIAAQALRIQELEDELHPPPPPPPADPLVMGADWSTANPPEPNYHEGAEAGLRCYTRQEAINAWNAATIKPKVVLVSDDKALPVSNPAAVGTAVTAFMQTWNSLAERAKTRVIWLWRNEIFNEYSSTVPDNVVAGFKAGFDAAKAFANCDTGVNATTWTITNGDAEMRWQKIAPYITVGTCSMYPPGRTKTPVEFTPYPSWVDPVLDMFEAWGIKEFMIGETGIPVDKADQTTGVPTSTNDWTKRPTYMKGLLQYIYDGCKQRGMKFTVALYWNRQKAVTESQHPPNQFKHDQGKPGGNTADMWFAFKPA